MYTSRTCYLEVKIICFHHLPRFQTIVSCAHRKIRSLQVAFQLKLSATIIRTYNPICVPSPDPSPVAYQTDTSRIEKQNASGHSQGPLRYTQFFLLLSAEVSVVSLPYSILET